MAVNAIFRAIIAVMGIGVCMYAFMPAVYSLYNVQTYWNEMGAGPNQVKDNIYTVLLALPLFMVGVVFLWSYMAVQKKDY
jgi:hypothetical protein